MVRLKLEWTIDDFSAPEDAKLRKKYVIFLSSCFLGLDEFQQDHILHILWEAIQFLRSEPLHTILVPFLDRGPEHSGSRYLLAYNILTKWLFWNPLYHQDTFDTILKARATIAPKLLMTSNIGFLDRFSEHQRQNEAVTLGSTAETKKWGADLNQHDIGINAAGSGKKVAVIKNILQLPSALIAECERFREEFLASRSGVVVKSPTSAVRALLNRIGGIVDDKILSQVYTCGSDQMLAYGFVAKSLWIISLWRLSDEQILEICNKIKNDGISRTLNESTSSSNEKQCLCLGGFFCFLIGCLLLRIRAMQGVASRTFVRAIETLSNMDTWADGSALISSSESPFRPSDIISLLLLSRIVRPVSIFAAVSETLYGLSPSIQSTESPPPPQLSLSSLADQQPPASKKRRHSSSDVNGRSQDGEGEGVHCLPLFTLQDRLDIAGGLKSTGHPQMELMQRLVRQVIPAECTNILIRSLVNCIPAANDFLSSLSDLLDAVLSPMVLLAVQAETKQMGSSSLYLPSRIYSAFSKLFGGDFSANFPHENASSNIISTEVSNILNALLTSGRPVETQTLVLVVSALTATLDVLRRQQSTKDITHSVIHQAEFSSAACLLLNTVIIKYSAHVCKDQMLQRDIREILLECESSVVSKSALQTLDSILSSSSSSRR